MRPRVEALPTRALGVVAIENAVEGCVRETFGALIASWQAEHARDPGIKRLMRSIARDETRHAFVVPTRSAIDDGAIAGLIRRGLLDDELVADVLAVDFTTPVYSKARASFGGLAVGSSCRPALQGAGHVGHAYAADYSLARQTKARQRE